MTQKIIFVDLDRTLFDTQRFMRVLWRTMADVYNLNAAHELADAPNWYQRVGALQYYRFELHAQQVTGHDIAQVLAAVRTRLAQEQFLFPDATEIFEWQKHGYKVRILSFGDAWFQNFKLSLVPALNTIPRDIILGPKNEFIARTYPQASGFLIDDKRNPDLPPSFTEIWLNREGEMANDSQSATVTITSLKQVQEVLL